MRRRGCGLRGGGKRVANLLRLPGKRGTGELGCLDTDSVHMTLAGQEAPGNGRALDWEPKTHIRFHCRSPSDVGWPVGRADGICPVRLWVRTR